MAMVGDRAAARYTKGAIWLHWIIAALILTNIALGLLGIIPVHKSIGFLVLVLSIVRLGWRLTHPAPPLPGHVPGWQRGVAHLSHWLFYGFMILMPLSGWIFSSAGETRRPLGFFDLFAIPYLPVAQDKAVGGWWHEVHVLMGWGLIALVVLHVAAALKHHLVDRDAVLHRMAPIVPDPSRG